MDPRLDPLTDFDWAAHWRALVEAREREVEVAAGTDFWAPCAHGFQYDPADAAKDPLLRVMEPYLGARKTAIDVGAGAGRHAVALAERLDWVTAVEPSEAMRSYIPHRDNLTVIAGGWLDADVAPADLVISAHVLYFVADPVPFIQKLSAAARERVFVFLRDRPLPTPSEALYEAFTGRPRTRMPRLADLWNLLQRLEIAADLTIFESRSEQVYQDVDEAAAIARGTLQAVWDERAGRSWLEEHLERRDDGSLAYGGPMVAGVAHWSPK